MAMERMPIDILNSISYETPDNLLEIEVTNPQTASDLNGSFIEYTVITKILVPALPPKNILRALNLGGDRFDAKFIEDRRKGLESFIKQVAGHPLAQASAHLHMFLSDEFIDKNV